jgi:Transposase IS116/IS110/IS902 family
LLGHRAALVRVATALQCRVRAVLADRGVGVEEQLWGPGGRVLLAELALPAVQPAIVTDCLALIDAISPLVARLERDLIARARPDPRVQALQALPGIGPITAMTLVAEIGDIARFPTARKLCAWAGLTPAVRNSDRKVRHGHITKMARRGSGSCSRRPPSGPRPARPSLASPPRPRPAAASTSPPWRSPASSLPAASMCSPSCKPLPEKVNLPGALAHHLCLNHGRRTD